MNSYELTVLVKADMKGEAREAFVKKIEKIVTAFKGRAVKLSELGLKQLAYPIQNLHEANYLQWVLELPNTVMVQLDKKLATEKDIMRFLLVKAE